MLDVPPTDKQAQALARIHDGDRVVVARGGRGYEFERGGTAQSSLVRRLLELQWVAEPQYPLFGADHDGRLTERGLAALRRAHHSRQT